MSIKEGLVRSQPINNEKFNFKISVAQFFIGLLISPAILQILITNGNTNPQVRLPFGAEEKKMTLLEYYQFGFDCMTSFENPTEET